MFREWLRNHTEQRYKKTLYKALLLGDNLFIESWRRRFYMDEAELFKRLVIERSGEKVERMIHRHVTVDVEHKREHDSAAIQAERDRIDRLRR